jgi:D-sedoheptulose 7-phosphate isomerase
MPTRSPIRAAFDEAQSVLRAFVEDASCADAMERFADAAEKTLRGGGTIYSCGNGGSMCDAMHFAEEWTGRFRKDRTALPALAFSDAGQISCIANDFGWEQVFARMLEAYARKGDLLLAISTSGSSPNVLRACESARRRGVTVVGLLGRGGGAMKELCDVAVVVPRATTSDRIQEIHIKVIHAVIESVERRMFPANYA